MFYLQYRVCPSPANPQHERLGEGLVCCWIDRGTLVDADRVARQTIREEHWQVLERECGEPATEADHAEDEEWLQYYCQALTDQEVFAFHLSPKHPVYWVTATVVRKAPPEAAAAHYFLAGDSILQEGDDLYAPAFWSKEVDRLAVAWAGAAIEAADWAMAGEPQRRPCGRDEVPQDLHFAYDEAEDSGSCLVFLHEGGAEAGKRENDDSV